MVNSSLRQEFHDDAEQPELADDRFPMYLLDDEVDASSEDDDELDDEDDDVDDDDDEDEGEDGL